MPSGIFNAPDSAYLSKSHSHLFRIGTEIDASLFIDLAFPVKLQQAVVHADHAFGHTHGDDVVDLVDFVFADHVSNRIV